LTAALSIVVATKKEAGRVSSPTASSRPQWMASARSLREARSGRDMNNLSGDRVWCGRAHRKSRVTPPESAPLLAWNRVRSSVTRGRAERAYTADSPILLDPT
jgi:hypothetical protein